MDGSARALEPFQARWQDPSVHTTPGYGVTASHISSRHLRPCRQFRTLTPWCHAQDATAFSAESWNYVSIGMDAKSAFGFHHLRETKPALAFSRAANQAWYGYFSCASGWFCGAEPLSKRMRLEVLDADGGEWRDVEVIASVQAIVLLNLQSYGGGRDLWGDHDTAVRAARALHAPALRLAPLLLCAVILMGACKEWEQVVDRPWPPCCL